MLVEESQGFKFQAHSPLKILRMSTVYCPPTNPTAVMPTLPLSAGDLRVFASSPALPLFTSTINIDYSVKNITDLV